MIVVGVNLHHGRGMGHGVWKTSEPLSDLDQLLNIAKHDPFVSAKWVVSVCSAQQRLVYTTIRFTMSLGNSGHGHVTQIWA